MQRGWARVAVAVALRPALWGSAARQGLLLARPGWWRRRPFLPLPAPDYLRFRMQTAYGDPGRPPEVADVLAYLHWCREYGGLVRP